MERVWIEGSSAVRSVPKDAVPTIDNPPFVGASRATFMEPEEMIIGVSDGAVTRAYSTWLLNRYEIVNDRIGGKPIVVTWCPLCFSGAVYVRLARGRELMFGNSGMLWRENLVLYDRQTESWWSQLAGRAIRGEMQGAYLDVYPATMMSWKQWVEAHPETEVLSKRTSGGVVGLRNESAAYQRSTRMGITGRTQVKLDDVGAKELVLGFELEGRHYSPLLGRHGRAQGQSRRDVRRWQTPGSHRPPQRRHRRQGVPRCAADTDERGRYGWSGDARGSPVP